MSTSSIGSFRSLTSQQLKSILLSRSNPNSGKGQALPTDLFSSISVSNTEGSSHYKTFAGTSMATPHVRGVAGLLMEDILFETEKAEKAELRTARVEEFRGFKETGLDTAQAKNVKSTLEKRFGVPTEGLEIVSSSEETFGDTSLGMPGYGFQVPTRGSSVLVKSKSGDDYYLLRHRTGDTDLSSSYVATWSGSEEIPPLTFSAKTRQVSDATFDLGPQK